MTRSLAVAFLILVGGFLVGTADYPVWAQNAATQDTTDAEAADRQARAEALQRAEAERQAAAQQQADEEARKAEEMRQAAEAARKAEEDRQIAQAEADYQTWEQTREEYKQEIKILSDKLTEMENNLSLHGQDLKSSLSHIDSQARRLFTLADAYHNEPLLLEALNRYGLRLAAQVEELTSGPRAVQRNLSELSDSVELGAKSIPPIESAKNDHQKEVVTDLQNRINEQRKRLDALKQQVDSRLKDSQALMDGFQKMDADISAYMPELWKNYYLVSPVRLLDPATWDDVGLRTTRAWEQFMQRLQVELPWSVSGLASLGGRLTALLLFMAIPLLLLWRKIRGLKLQKSTRHALTASLPWFLVGVAVMMSSLGQNGDFYRSILVTGSIIVIWAEMSLAWDCRRLRVNSDYTLSPLWPLLLPMVGGALLIYIDLPKSVLSVAWGMVILMAFLVSYLSRPSSAIPSLERYLLVTHRIILGISLLLTVIGWPRGAMLLYAASAAVLVSIQLTIALIYATESIARRDDDTPGNFLGDLAIAFAAPVVLLLVVAAMVIWLLAWPGGFALFTHFLQTGISIGQTQFNPLQLLLILSGFYVTRAAISVSKGFLNKLYTTTSQFDSSLLAPLQTGVTYTLWILFGLFSLHTLGFGLENIAMIAGGLSVGIGFGMQTIVNNFLSGLILIFSRTLHEGDVVEVGTLTGVVRKISIRATTVETFDNAVIFVPNSEFVSTRLINWTRNNRHVRRDVAVGVAYGTDPVLVENLLIQAAGEAAKVLKYPAPLVLFGNFGNSTLDFTLRYWSDIMDTGTAASNIRKEIARLFGENNVEIAFPQMDIHLYRSGAPVAPANVALPQSGTEDAAKISTAEGEKAKT